MSILDLFKKKCTHSNMPINVQCGYCPDCGQYVENRWYLVRCSCCGVKRIAHTRGTEICPKNEFCSNCGETGYFIEELRHLNIVDINYATLLRVTPKDVKENYSQSWIQNAPPSVRLICAS